MRRHLTILTIASALAIAATTASHAAQSGFGSDHPRQDRVAVAQSQTVRAPHDNPYSVENLARERDPYLIPGDALAGGQ